MDGVLNEEFFDNPGPGLFQRLRTTIGSWFKDEYEEEETLLPNTEFVLLSAVEERAQDIVNRLKLLDLPIISRESLQKEFIYKEGWKQRDFSICITFLVRHHYLDRRTEGSGEYLKLTLDENDEEITEKDITLFKLNSELSKREDLMKGAEDQMDKCWQLAKESKKSKND